jgi:hypothetical protein
MRDRSSRASLKKEPKLTVASGSAAGTVAHTTATGASREIERFWIPFWSLKSFETVAPLRLSLCFFVFAEGAGALRVICYCLRDVCRLHAFELEQTFPGSSAYMHVDWEPPQHCSLMLIKFVVLIDRRNVRKIHCVG